MHRGLKKFPALGFSDSVEPRADQLYPIALKDARFGKRYSNIERGLTTHRRQQRIGAFTGDDLLDDLGGDGLDISAIGHLRIGHDSGGIAIHQDDLIAFLLQRFTRLRPRVIEFARLADDDGPGAHDENFLDVCPLGHTTDSFSLRLPSTYGVYVP